MVQHLKQTIKNVSLDLIDEPRGILRMDIDADDLAELSRSISEIGLLQPIMVAKNGDRFEVVFGHRRFLAHQKLGLPTIRATVRDMTESEIGLARATENISRSDLSPVEEATTYKNLIDQYGMTLEQVAIKIGKTAGTVKRRMDMLRMPPSLQEAMHKKLISMSVAEELWPISDPTSLEYYLSFALEGGCTKEVARTWCKDWKDQKRRAESSSGGGGQPLAPSEPRPVYVACDLCTGPMELGQEVVLRVCENCFGTIKQNM